MIYCVIYLLIGLGFGLTAVSNLDSDDLEDGYYFAGVVVSGFIWPISCIIGIIGLMIDLKNRKA